jgi:hypothetical protein
VTTEGRNKETGTTKQKYIQMHKMGSMCDDRPSGGTDREKKQEKCFKLMFEATYGSSDKLFQE